MGSEFLRNKRQSRAKGWNRQLHAGAADLLVSLAPGEERGCRASVHGTVPPIGSKVVLELLGDHVLVRDRNICIGEISQPKPELVADLRKCTGMAVGQVRAHLEAASCIDLVVVP